jgi:TRAP-type mannitol/chloroaromatic compound transport system permease small subunit
MSNMLALYRRIDLLNEYLGRGIAWLVLVLVLLQFVVVILRYVFSIGFIPMQ